MLKFATNDIEEQNFLILNYNTILIQSYGYLKYMEKLGFQNAFSDMLELDYVVNTLQYINRNTATIIDSTISDTFYFDFVKANFKEVTDRSYVGSLTSMIDILKGQPFVKSIHIASPTEFSGEVMFNNVKFPIFNIFDPVQVVQYMNDNNITSLLLDDATLLRDIVSREDFDCEQVTFLLSSTGYNYILDDPEMNLIHPEIMELKKVKNFKFGLVDIIENEAMHDSSQETNN
jgi:hypothetical protein